MDSSSARNLVRLIFQVLTAATQSTAGQALSDKDVLVLLRAFALPFPKQGRLGRGS